MEITWEDELPDLDDIPVPLRPLYESDPEVRQWIIREYREKKRLEGENAELTKRADSSILDPVTSTIEHPVFNRYGYDFLKHRYFATGLPEALAVRVGRELRERGDKHDYSLLLIDLYDFGHTNERLGHSGGDGVFQYVAKQILGGLRRTDSLCRWGGDEFVVFIQVPYSDHTSPYTSSAVVPQRLARVLLANAHLLPDGAKPFGFYGGLATSLEAFERSFTSPDELFDLADKRLYVAKKHTYERDACTIVGENDEVIYRAPIVRPVATTP